jgi:hypothetical protein
VDAHVDLKRKEIKQNWGVKVSYTYRYVKFAQFQFVAFLIFNQKTDIGLFFTYIKRAYGKDVPYMHAIRF